MLRPTTLCHGSVGNALRGVPERHRGRSLQSVCLAWSALLFVSAGAAEDQAQPIVIDQEKRTISLACQIAPRKLPNLAEVYPIEVIAAYPAPRGQKAHETVVTCEVKPSDVHKALEGLGLKPGKPAKGEGAVASGPEVKVFIELPSGTSSRRVPIERALVDRKTGKQMPALKWYFTGSAMKQPDPDKDMKTYGADDTGTLIAIFPVTDDTVIQTNMTMKEEPLLKLETNKTLLPAEGTMVRLLIEAK